MYDGARVCVYTHVQAPLEARLQSPESRSAPRDPWQNIQYLPPPFFFLTEGCIKLKAEPDLGQRSERSAQLAAACADNREETHQKQKAQAKKVNMMPVSLPRVLFRFFKSWGALSPGKSIQKRMASKPSEMQGWGQERKFLVLVILRLDFFPPKGGSGNQRPRSIRDASGGRDLASIRIAASRSEKEQPRACQKCFFFPPFFFLLDRKLSTGRCELRVCWFVGLFWGG